MKAGPHFSLSVAPLRRKDFENTKRNHLINWILNDWTFNFVDCHSNLHLEWSISFCCFYTCTAVYETNMKTMRLKSVKLGTKSENVKWNGDPRWSTVIHGDSPMRNRWKSSCQALERRALILVDRFGPVKKMFESIILGWKLSPVVFRNLS